MSHHSNDEDPHTGQDHRPESLHDKQQLDSETGTEHGSDPMAGAVDPDAGEPGGQDSGAETQSEVLSRPEQILQDAVDKEEDISDEEAVLAYNANTGPDAGEPGGQSAGAETQREVLSRPEQILQDAVDKEEDISDEEAVLAYNANAEPEPEVEGTGTAAEE